MAENQTKTYEVQGFRDGETILTAEHLFKMEQGIIAKQDHRDKITTIDANADDDHYPSAKAVYKFVNDAASTVENNIKNGAVTANKATYAESAGSANALTEILGLARGGTGATNASEARASLDVYSKSETANLIPAWAKSETKPTYTASEVGAIPATAIGTSNGVASLDTNGKIPSNQLPEIAGSFVEGYYLFGKFYTAFKNGIEISATLGKIYVDIPTNKIYRWDGDAYVEIASSLELGETELTAYPGNLGKANADNIEDINARTIDNILAFIDEGDSYVDGDDYATNGINCCAALTLYGGNYEPIVINDGEAGDGKVDFIYKIPIMPGDNVTFVKDDQSNMVKINSSVDTSVYATKNYVAENYQTRNESSLETINKTISTAINELNSKQTPYISTGLARNNTLEDLRLVLRDKGVGVIPCFVSFNGWAKDALVKVGNPFGNSLIEVVWFDFESGLVHTVTESSSTELQTLLASFRNALDTDNKTVRSAINELYDKLENLDLSDTYGAAGTSLGLVKSGGNVTISEGIITVNDDGHNHTIENVDGLQNILNTQFNDAKKYTDELSNDISSGRIIVEQATKAANDINNNSIVDTYATKTLLTNSINNLIRDLSDEQLEENIVVVKALGDADGNEISKTYATKSEVSSGQIIVDSALSDTSTNPVQNKVITESLTSHTNNTSNPHNITKVTIGLSSVENKSSSAIRSELTKTNVTTALGYEPATTTRVSNIEQNITSNIRPYTVNQISSIEAGDTTVSDPDSDGVLVTADISIYSRTDESSMVDGQMKYYVPIVEGNNIKLEKDSTNNVIKINAVVGDVDLSDCETKTDASAKLTEAKTYTNDEIKKIINGDAGYIPRYAVDADNAVYANEAGVASSAAQATEDGVGNNIVNTYQPKSDSGLTTIAKNIVDAINEVNIKADNGVDTSNLATIDKITLFDTWAGDDIEDLSTADGDGITWSDYFKMQGNEESGYSELGYGSITHRVPIIAGNGVEFEIEENRVKINATGGVDKIKSISTCIGNEGCWDEGDGIAWDSAYAFYDENGDEITTGTISHMIPVTAGENIAFSYDEENNAIAINATGDTIDKIQSLDTWSGGVKEILFDSYEGVSWNNTCTFKTSSGTHTADISHLVPITSGNNITFTPHGNLIEISATGTLSAGIGAWSARDTAILFAQSALDLEACVGDTSVQAYSTTDIEELDDNSLAIGTNYDYTSSASSATAVVTINNYSDKLYLYADVYVEVRGIGVDGAQDTANYSDVIKVNPQSTYSYEVNTDINKQHQWTINIPHIKFRGV